MVFLSFAWRLLPRGRKAAAAIDAAFTLEGYTTEASVPEKSPAVGKTVGELEAMAEGVEVFMLVRGRSRRLTPADSTEIKAGDILLIEGEPAALDRLVDKAGLKLAREDTEQPPDTPRDEIGVMEAVVERGFPAGRPHCRCRRSSTSATACTCSRSAGAASASRSACARCGSRAGDVIVLRGHLPSLPETLGELRCLPLAARDLRLGRGGRSMLPLSILVLAMAFVAANVIPVSIAFFAAAVAMLLIRALTLREAYEAVDWPILVMLGALIPVSDSLRTTGGTDLIAGALSSAAQNLPPIGALALIMIAAMAVTPFLNNAATVLVMAPIAASFAKTLGYSPDPFLMAIAIGAACDFLTPVGHQCNTLVMGPGGYRFGDYWRLGLPLSIMVVLAGVPLIALFWPLRAG